MQKSLNIIDAIINTLNTDNSLNNNYSAQMQAESINSESNQQLQSDPMGNKPQPKKQKVTHDNNDNDNNKMDVDVDEEKEDPAISSLKLTNKTSYPMPSPRPRKQSMSNRVFNPSEYEHKYEENEDETKISTNIDLEASVSALPPLVAQKSISDTNQMELYGWGCVDPLLYSAKSGKTPRVSIIGNDDNNDNDFEDEIIKPRCLIPEGSIKFNFNDLNANFNGASLWQRDCNGFYGWGDNEDGAIGDGINSQIKDPKDMHAFHDRPVRFVSVGEKHTGVIIQYGGLHVFGCNENGQCGQNETDYFRVKPDLVVPGLENAKMCQVACGAAMTLALTRHGTLYSFGNKDVDGLLGRSNFVRWPNFQANVIPNVYFNCVTEISVGERHCLLRTRYNRIFGWGKNNHGQLGMGDTQTRHKPTEILALTQIEMLQIECGGSHTAVLTKSGQIWCFGNNNNGQCGSNPDEKLQILRPTKVEGKWGQNKLTQIGCGRYHTLCTDSNKVWAFGTNLQGQCTGNESDGRKIWDPIEVPLNLTDDQRRIITRICGTNFSSLILSKIVDIDYVPKCGSLYKLQPMDLPCSIDFTQLDILCRQIENQQSDITYMQTLLSTIFGSPSCLNQSFMTNINNDIGKPGTGIDFNAMSKAYNRILDISPILTNRLVKSLLTLSRRSLKYVEDMNEATNLRFYFLILAYPDIVNPGFNHEILKQMNEIIRRIKRSKPEIFKKLSEWISTWPLKDRMILLSKLQECMSMYLEIKNKTDLYVAFICDPILMIYESNNLIKSEKDKISYDKFYNRTLTRNGYLDFRTDYVQWANPNYHNTFSFCEYPFLLDPVAKRQILKIEKDAMKQYAARPNMQQMFQAGIMGLGRPFMYSPFFVISVRRNYILQDTLNFIVRTAQNGAQEFRKELKIIFDNEEGVDQGGVRKEFFQLIIRECFDIKYGTFVFNEETRCYWFNQNALEQPEEYMLLGIIIGLAIYNGVLLDIHFPPVIYKKMCGQLLTRYDLKGYDPQIFKSIQQIIQYKGNINDLCLTFSIDYMKWDKLETVDLIENGRNIQVNNDNRDKYIQLLTNYYLTESIKKQFDHFLKGFKLVLQGKAFDMIKIGQELELLICGNQTLDFDALEVSCKYEGGYNNDHKVIRWFWEILHEFSQDEKKKFLKFFSGSDRAPLRGLGKLGMLVQKATGDDYNGDQLPTAHTCFNALLLPSYANKELMRNKLLAAIQFSEGFGLK